MHKLSHNTCFTAANLRFLAGKRRLWCWAIRLFKQQQWQWHYHLLVERVAGARKWHFLCISHSLNGVNYCCQQMHYFPYPTTHTGAHTLGGLYCLVGNKSKPCLKSYGTIWCWSTAVYVRNTTYHSIAANSGYTLTNLKTLFQIHLVCFISHFQLHMTIQIKELALTLNHTLCIYVQYLSCWSNANSPVSDHSNECNHGENK